MSDLISRQAVIKLIRESADDFSKLVYGMVDPYDLVFKVGHLPSAEPERRWIPCAERLPDNEKRVLCTVQSGEHFCVVPCIFIQHTRRWLPEVYGNHDNVIAWMPLPEPWRGEE